VLYDVVANDRCQRLHMPLEKEGPVSPAQLMVLIEEQW